MENAAAEQIPLFQGSERGAEESARSGSSQSSPASVPPAVATLLALDEEYRARALAGTLPRITPRRLNPHHHAWLPVLRTERDGWRFQAFFSNTWRAHQFGRTDDWVVIYYERDGDHGQATVVTERKGRLRGKRVVRGRELESLRAHRAAPSPRRLAG